MFEGRWDRRLAAQNQEEPARRGTIEGSDSFERRGGVVILLSATQLTNITVLIRNVDDCCIVLVLIFFLNNYFVVWMIVVFLWCGIDIYGPAQRHKRRPRKAGP